jgi:hypothetical protein
MTEQQKQSVKQIIETFAKLTEINDKQICQNLITRLNGMDENDVVDYLIVSLSDLIDKGHIQATDVLAHIDLLTVISPKYTTQESLTNRLNWLKSMNLTHPAMPLAENHKLVTEIFDKFNQIIGTDFDTHYTGGLMGYFATNHQLERYHSDLDLFVNEAQLESIYQLVEQSTDFKLISNLDDKTDHTGHEFKINYKDTPMSIGLFLFGRKPDDEIVLKSYYHLDDKTNTDLFVDEKHLTPDYAKMIFTNKINTHNNIPYKMQSLESIYNSKKGSRPKDQYDASIIQDHIDLTIDQNIDQQKNNNYTVTAQPANNSLVAQFTQKIKLNQSTMERTK